MKKINKGFYSPTEDDQAPVPKSYRFDEGDESGEYSRDNGESDDLEATPDTAVEEV